MFLCIVHHRSIYNIPYFEHLTVMIPSGASKSTASPLLSARVHQYATPWMANTAPGLNSFVRSPVVVLNDTGAPEICLYVRGLAGLGLPGAGRRSSRPRPTCFGHHGQADRRRSWNGNANFNNRSSSAFFKMNSGEGARK